MGWHNVGVFFRERATTAHYARFLLKNHMLNNVPDVDEKVDRIIEQILFKSPSHEFDIDYQLARRMGLPVDKMTTELSDMARKLVSSLDRAVEEKLVCRYVGDKYSLPFFRLYGGVKNGG